jgi:5'(3')-deoxyribonucleotidase
MSSMLPKRTIIVDVDDTILKSSEEVIRQLNRKNGTNKTLNDMWEYNYSSIDPNATQNDIVGIYASQEFFDNVEFNDGALEFLQKYQDLFHIVMVTSGCEHNLEQKTKWLIKQKENYNLDKVDMIGLLTTSQNKRDIFLSNVYMAIDDKTEHLEEHNAPAKVLLKNYHDTAYNQVPVNSEWYVVNDFYDVIKMIDFYLMLQKEGFYIG